MYEEEDRIRLKTAHTGVGLPIGAVGRVISTYVDGVNAVEVLFEREVRGEVQLLLSFNEIEPMDCEALSARFRRRVVQ